MKLITVKELAKETSRGTDFVTRIVCRGEFDVFRQHSHFHIFEDCEEFRKLWLEEYKKKIGISKKVTIYENSNRNAAGLSGCICCGVYLGDFVQPETAFP